MMLFGGSVMDGDPYVTMGARNGMVTPFTVIVSGREAIALGMIASTRIARTSGIVVYVDDTSHHRRADEGFPEDHADPVHHCLADTCDSCLADIPVLE